VQGDRVIRRALLLTVSVACVISAGALFGRHGYLLAKAELAERLIDASLANHLEDGRPHPPWRWADMHPVARLEVPRLGVSRNVLTGATGESMAFGVGHIHGTAPPNGEGNCVLAGHRDSWLEFLRDVRVGDRLRLVSSGSTREWIVEGMHVVGAWDAETLEPGDGDRLTLVTCWPFDGLLRSPYRYVVECRPS
jgi:sortase A